MTKRSTVLHTEHHLLSVRLVADTWLVSTRGCGEQSFCEHRRAGSSLRPCFHLGFVPAFGLAAVRCVGAAPCVWVRRSLAVWALSACCCWERHRCDAASFTWTRFHYSWVFACVGFFPRPQRFSDTSWASHTFDPVPALSSWTASAPQVTGSDPQDCPCLHLKTPVTGPGCHLCL